MEHELDQKSIDALFDLATYLANNRGLPLKDWDAVYVLFADRFGWTPSQVRALSTYELDLLLRNCVAID